MLKNVILGIAIIVTSLVSAQQQDYKVRRYTIGTSLFHGMGGADLTINEASITFTNNLAPEFNVTYNLSNLEEVSKDELGWVLRSKESSEYRGVERDGVRIIYTEHEKKPTLTVQIKDSFTGEVLSRSFLLIK